MRSHTTKVVTIRLLSEGNLFGPKGVRLFGSFCCLTLLEGREARTAVSLRFLLGLCLMGAKEMMLLRVLEARLAVFPEMVVWFRWSSVKNVIEGLGVYSSGPLVTAKDYLQLESLILAQSERWRQA